MASTLQIVADNQTASVSQTRHSTKLERSLEAVDRSAGAHMSEYESHTRQTGLGPGAEYSIVRRIEGIENGIKECRKRLLTCALADIERERISKTLQT